jgi:hypothetical protein
MYSNPLDDFFFPSNFHFVFALQQQCCQLVYHHETLRFVLYKPEIIDFGTQREIIWRRQPTNQQKERDSLYISTPGGLKP